MTSRRGIFRYALVAEAIVCFGPLTAILLAGAATFAFSLIAIVSALFELLTQGRSEAPLWALMIPVIAVPAGGCGLFALLAVVQGLCAEPPKLAYSRNALLVMMTAGLIAPLTIAGIGSMDSQYTVSSWLFVWLPLASSVHIIFLARQLLFGRQST